MTGLYIHIPFCASRCVYCGFYSTTRTELQDRYVDALCHEMQLRPLTKGAISTIYIGGGTPSMLSVANLNRLLIYINKVYPVADGAEVTIECNPDDVCHPGFILPPQINRVSMGAQTFSDQRLRFLNRRHNAAEVVKAVERLRQWGIRNISLDLMFGFPSETLADWQSDIGRTLDLQVEHLSAYSLMYEEGTPLFRMLKQGRVQEINDELSLDMYNLLVDRLTGAGYEHYEISNFARPGFRSKHNSSYWHDIPYIGLGAAAHSYSGTERSWNCADLQAYIQAIESGLRPCEVEQIDASTHYNDIITTALRTREGIDIGNLPCNQRKYLLQSASKYLNEGLLCYEQGRLHLTRQGIYLSDTIMSDLMWV